MDDVCRLRDFLVAASADAKYRVGVLHKAALDAPMHFDLLRSLREIIVLCKEKVAPPPYVGIRGRRAFTSHGFPSTPQFHGNTRSYEYYSISSPTREALPEDWQVFMASHYEVLY